VSRRTRRVLPLVLSIALGLGLAGCGDDDGGGGSASSDPLSTVTITGDVGKAPEVKWDGDFEAEEITSETITEGDGETVEAGDQVSAHFWIGNGFEKKQAFSSYDEGGAQDITVDEQSLSKVFLEGMEGHTIGSRVAVAATAEEAFGEAGNAQLGIGNKDSVLIIVDLIDMFEPPKPTEVPQSQMPTIVEKNGEPVSLDFEGVAKPAADDDLQRTILKEGDGAEVTAESTITADYLGMVYDGKKPFDESYSKEPAQFSLTQVVKGWTYGLSGLKVGSRVLLAIPPDLGYGAQEQANIPANSTLYFVVDIVSAQ
jgi:peptidylprolyl isomerase